MGDPPVALSIAGSDPSGGAGVQGAQEAVDLCAGRGLDAQPLQQGGAEAGEGDQAVVARAGLSARQADHQRHVEHGVAHLIVVVEAQVLAQGLAVVGQHHHVGLVQQAALEQ